MADTPNASTQNLNAPDEKTAREAMAVAAVAKPPVITRPDHCCVHTYWAVIERDGTRRDVDAPLGLSVLEIAHQHGVDIEGACEG